LGIGGDVQQFCLQITSGFSAIADKMGKQVIAPPANTPRGPNHCR
jgi:hypothetical protein